MTTTVYGEITADGDGIVLVAAGRDAHVIRQASVAIQKMTPLVKQSDPPGALVMPLTWPAVTQLAFTFGQRWQPMERLLEWIQAQVAVRTSDLEHGLDYDVPDGLIPRDYQIVGAHLIARLGSAILTDEQRTGKTITTILGLCQMNAAHSGLTFPTLVVAPAGTVDLGWVRAFQTWAPHLRTVTWRGPNRYALAGTADVYVTSFEVATRDAADLSRATDGLRPPAEDGPTRRCALLRLGLRTLVVDEMHYLANPKAKRSLAVRRVGHRTQNFVGLGGTPIKKHTGDFWATLNAMDEASHPSSERWNNRYLEMQTPDYGVEVVGLAPHREPEFRMTLLGQERRVTRADVLDDLPEKVYTVRRVRIPSEWRSAYDQFEAKMLAELPDDSGELSVMDVFTQFGHLSRLASSAADVEITTELVEEDGQMVEKEHVHLKLKAPSWKIDELMNVLEEREDEQAIVFAPSKQLVTLAGQAAAEAGYKIGYLTGGITAKQKTEVVDGFQAGEIQHLFATTGAGGTGLTLTAGGVIVYLARPLSMVESLQSEDRSSGIGSEKHDCIEIIDIVAENTTDERIRDLLVTKGGQLSELVRDPRIVVQMLGGATVTTIHPEQQTPVQQRPDWAAESRWS